MIKNYLNIAQHVNCCGMSSSLLLLWLQAVQGLHVWPQVQAQSTSHHGGHCGLGDGRMRAATVLPLLAPWHCTEAGMWGSPPFPQSFLVLKRKNQKQGNDQPFLHASPPHRQSSLQVTSWVGIPVKTSSPHPSVRSLVWPAGTARQFFHEKHS